MIKKSDKLKYLGISAIYINKAMNKQEESKITDILFSFNEVKQIYFVDNVDFKTIERIKYSIEISPATKDENIEKIIFAELNAEDENSLLKMRVKNPDTWLIAYERQANNIYTCSLSDYKDYLLYIKNLKTKIKNSSLQEIIDFIAIELDGFKYSDDNLNIIEQIISKRILKDNYLILMKKLLKDLSYNSYITKTKDEEYLLINKDKNYYFISKNARDLKTIKEIKGLLSPLKYLGEEDLDYANRKYNLYLEKTTDSLERDLSKNFRDIYKEINS